eukprot:27398-Chlamydomonas_euryale.AAC.1
MERGGKGGEGGDRVAHAHAYAQSALLGDLMMDGWPSCHPPPANPHTLVLGNTHSQPPTCTRTHLCTVGVVRRLYDRRVAELKRHVEHVLLRGRRKHDAAAADEPHARVAKVGDVHLAVWLHDAHADGGAARHDGQLVCMADDLAWVGAVR